MSETSETGYICTDCGAHIAGWQGHCCAGAQPTAPVIASYMSTPGIDSNTWARIAAALERIADALEKEK